MPDWRRWCNEAGHAVNGDGVTVRFTGGRSHRVTVTAGAGGWTLRGVVLRANPLTVAGTVLHRIAVRNRSSVGVGCRLHPLLGVVAEAHVPQAGVDAGEFAEVLRLVAAEADRLEFLLTSRDVE